MANTTPEPFEFDEDNHIYTQARVQLPGCTRVIDCAAPEYYATVAKDIIERKSQLGRRVHKATRFHDEGDLEWNSLSDEAKGRVESWVNFCAVWNFTPNQHGTRLIAEFNGMKYGMEIDCAGLIKRQEAIIEQKTTASQEPIHQLQLAGYSMGLPHKTLLSPMSKFLARRRVIVYLNKGGKFKAVECTDRRDYTIFHAMLAVTWWKLEHKHKIRGIENGEAGEQF